MVLELLAVRDLTTRVLMSRDDAVRLFGAYAAEVEVPGLVVLDSPEDVMTELEVEIVRSAPPWVGRRLALCGKDEAVRRLAGFWDTHPWSSARTSMIRPRPSANRTK
ncbi:hypothetical protein [Microtetraspora malaysiensis]|uniref:hypothetical protein n=1 Tax=Microtetraspora malaysiensis TaxID=161358 RepID=UPI003D92FCEC